MKINSNKTKQQSGTFRYLILLGLFVSVFSFNIPLHGQENEKSQQKFENFNPEDFDESSINITNEWMPLKPLARYVYEGTTVEEGEKFAHRVIITVTDFTKIINGVNCVVTWDLDYSNGELVEAELAFFAQDKHGNVWRMGEYPEEYEDGKFVKAPCWISGMDGAFSGISMKANPELGMPSYSQGWAPSVEFADRGQVDQMGIKNCVPIDCYENVLVIAETSELEPDATQLKFFASGVGNIRVGWRGEGEVTQEVLELVEIQQLALGALDEARLGVQQLEKHAYEVSKDIYALTEQIKQRSSE